MAAVVLTQLAPGIGIGDQVSSAAHLAGTSIGTIHGYLLRPTSTPQQQPAEKHQEARRTRSLACTTALRHLA